MHRSTPSAALRTVSVVAVASLAVLAPARAASAEARAHEELRAAEPGEGEVLAEVPTTLRLTFINAVRLPFAHVSLLGPTGSVELGEPRRATDAAHVLVAPIEGRLVAGDYTVRWQVAGPDGHPVRGEYAFTILADAEGLPPPGAAADTEGAGRPGEGAGRPEPVPLTSDFDAQSPLYVGVRWLTFLGLLGVIGTATFGLLILPIVRRSKDSGAEDLIRAATPRSLVIGMAATGLVAVALVLRLYAQSYALHGPTGALDPAALANLLRSTTWGLGWWVQFFGTAAALGGFLGARRRARGGWGVAAVGAVLLAFSPAFSGHSAAVTGVGPLAVLADGLHVLGAGGWLGTLGVVVVAGIPAARGQTERRRAAIAALINAFSPTALFFAGLVVATGIVSAWLHLGTASALWTSAYGRTLLLKVGALALLFATGAYNWRRVKPALGEQGATRLRRSAAFELAVGVIVLAVTAVLVATSPP